MQELISPHARPTRKCLVDVPDMERPIYHSKPLDDRNGNAYMKAVTEDHAMALTPAEKQRRYRKRKREKEKNRSDATHDFLLQPFFEWMGNGGRWEDITFPLGVAGFEFLPFWDDTGGKEIARKFDEWGADEGYYDDFGGSVGRGELLVSCLLDAATGLASRLNQYKLEQIEYRIAELEKADLAHPVDRKKALADIVRLSRIRDRLRKEKRWSLREWTVKEV
ncbi:hypothetical protein [Aquibium sp. ELW1220]|uniref:hypothetical protein n=1 Tax=Aquibium sp. ELW1220 TaxID=2976766 RepID=UPI0025B27FB6|nr:hypothetical protein [Aquibium sp. ELW1220]MDN2580878.1 hypothetical protein [Aquibium sp. ELW1220]